MRRLIVITSAAAALVFAASALAVLPSQKSVFKGYTTEHAVNGFKPTIQFTAQPGGKTLTNFTFQTLGCFGYGHVPGRRRPVRRDAVAAAEDHRPVDGHGHDEGQRDLDRARRREDGGHVHGHVHELVEDDREDHVLARTRAAPPAGPRTVKFTVSTNAPVSLGP